MIRQAEALAREGKPHYIEIQGASYEGCTVWVNAMVPSAGGRILSADGQQVVLGPPAQRGVDLIGHQVDPRLDRRGRRGSHHPDGTTAVNDANLDIGDGEFMILVGPSGCGKSTCLNMIAGLENISEGQLRIGDR
jgi:ABC-type multidrug transport system fused ATPase/permease subunit